MKSSHSFDKSDQSKYIPQEVNYTTYPKELEETSKLYIPKNFDGVDRLPIGSVTLGYFIGKGAFGQVYSGKWNNRPVAMKEIDIALAQQKLNLDEEEVIEALEWEISRLSTVSHPNVVQFYGIYEENNKIYLIMEFCENGNLQNTLQNKICDIEWSMRWQWALEIATGLAYLHQQGVLHRDLKAENVLLGKHKRAMLADLGVAQVDNLLQTNEASVIAKELQDRRFIAPERIREEKEGGRFRSTVESDIYALGLVFWQLTTGELPRNPERVEGHERETIPQECPEAFKNLILNCWESDPKKRPKAEEVIERLIFMAAEFHHPNSDMVITCEQIEELIHPKRLETLKYIDPFLTEYELRESVGLFWEEENKSNPIQLLELNKIFAEFLTNPTSSTLVLLGDAGLGKTLSTYKFANELMAKWWQYILCPTGNETPYLPVLIRPNLTTWTYQELNNSLTKVLNCKTYKAISKNIDARLLVIVDGYDECQARDVSQNLVQQLGIMAFPNAKLLVTCRVDTVEKADLKKHFNFNDNLKVLYFLPFNINQLLNYLKYNLYWDNNTYEYYKQKLTNYRELRTALSNPFVLSLFAQSWETISQKDFEQINRFEIYEGFVEHWINKKKNLLSGQIQQVLKASYLNLIESFRDFAANVAFTDFRKGNITSLSSPWMWMELQENINKDAAQSFTERKKNLNEKDIFRELLTMEDFTNIMLNRLQQFMLNSPLKTNKQAKHYEFVHKSFLEYFVAKILWKHKDLEEQFFDKWNTRNITEEPGIINFLTDCFELLDIDSKNICHQKFINYIKKSKIGSIYNNAAAGAMSFLNKINFSFSNEDLSGLNISGADLRYGIFDSTNFKGTNLDYLNFTGSWLRNAILEEASMQDVIFSEMPFINIKLNGIIRQPRIVCYSENGDYLAIASTTRIFLYDARNYTEITNLTGSYSLEIECMRFYPNNLYLVFGGKTNSNSSILNIWDIKENSLNNYSDDILCTNKNSLKNVICSHENERLLVVIEDNNNINYVGIFSIKENTLTFLKSFKSKEERIIMADFFNKDIVISCGIRNENKSIIAFWDCNHSNIYKDIEIISESEISKVTFYNQHIVFGYNDGNVKKFYVDKNNIKDLKLIFEFDLQVGESAVKALIFLNEELIISASSNKITIWNIKTKQLTKTFAGHTSDVSCIVLSGSNQELASVGWTDKRVMLWKIDVVNNYNIRSNLVVNLAFAADGKYLVSATQDNKIKIYEVKKGMCIKKLPYYQNEYAKTLQFSPDNQYVGFLSDRALKIWRWKNSQNYEIKIDTNEDTLSFLLDNKELILAIYEYSETKQNLLIKFEYWSIENLCLQKTITTTITINPDYIIKSAFFINNRKFICLLSYNYDLKSNFISIWDTKCGKELAKSDSLWYQGILYLINNNKFILYQISNQQQIFDENLKLIKSIKFSDIENTCDKINCIAISRDNQFIAITYTPGYHGSYSYPLKIISKHNIYTVYLTHKTNSLCWNKTEEGLFLATGNEDGLYYWCLKIQKENTIYLSLCWATCQQTLILDGSIYSNCANLSPQNLALLEQRKSFLKSNNQKLNNQTWLPQFTSQAVAKELVEQSPRSYGTSSISNLFATSSILQTESTGIESQLDAVTLEDSLPDKLVCKYNARI